MIRRKTPTGIDIGDALGIGPEVTGKALADPAQAGDFLQSHRD